jgi:hypothetical protein
LEVWIEAELAEFLEFEVGHWRYGSAGAVWSRAPIEVAGGWRV